MYHPALDALGTRGGKPDGAEDLSRDELIKLIHQPWWTTPAEYILVASQVEAITQAALGIQQTHQGLLQGSRIVGQR